MVRQFYFRLVVCVLVILPGFAYSQYGSGLPAGFGIDGDVLAARSLNVSSGAVAASFDWFPKITATGTGIGVVDTSNSASLKAQLASGSNIAFSKGLAFNRFSTQNGYLLLDARYSRDYFGLANSTGLSDLTTFTNGSKNGDNPTGWSTTPAGALVGDKADIIDSYIHLRRDGNTVNTSNPSALIMAIGASTLGSTGQRYVDFELFHKKIMYDGSTGAFSNSGPASSGGHTAWTFKADGSVKDVGDLTVSFAYSTNGVDEISVYLWMSQSDYLSVIPQSFALVPNQFYGSTYGYAKITPLVAQGTDFWGSTNTATTPGPAWGTSSKLLGSTPNRYYSENYGSNQFGEAAINLTKLGVDPAMINGMDPCSLPYLRVVIKTRSSAAFTSSLQDFSGPYDILDAAPIPAEITPKTLSCSNPSVTLAPVSPVNGGYYTWTTSDGNIVSNTVGSSITVNQPGTYYLTSALAEGCTTRKTDSVLIKGDFFQPVATASVVGMVLPGAPAITASLIGGNENQSNVPANFGGSTGLLWQWTGPSGFTAFRKDTVTNLEGQYMLVLTETRNGCKDTAYVSVGVWKVLPSFYLNADGKATKTGTEISWATSDDSNGSNFEIERAFSVNQFKTIGSVSVPVSVTTIQKGYQFQDNSAGLAGKSIVYYRIKLLQAAFGFEYSPIVAVDLKKREVGAGISVSPNPFAEKVTLSYEANNAYTAVVNIINLHGQAVNSQSIQLQKGMNQAEINGLANLQAGVYIVQLMVDGVMTDTKKVLKQ